MKCIVWLQFKSFWTSDNKNDKTTNITKTMIIYIVNKYCNSIQIIVKLHYNKDICQMHKCKIGMQSFILARISDFKLQEIKDKSNTIKKKKKEFK